MDRPLQPLLVIAAVIFLAACAPVAATPTPTHAVSPGVPSYSQALIDCHTYAPSLAEPPIVPLAGCDSWHINRYERPINQVQQDEYFAEIDIEVAEFGEVAGWYYARLQMRDVADPSGDLPGRYAIEFDTDQDGRGDILVLVATPEEHDGDWSVAWVQVWSDSDEDVGSDKPLQPDLPDDTNGYDELIFDGGRGDDPDLAWARAVYDQPAVVEIAFKSSLLSGDESFKYWFWADNGVAEPADYDLHDAYTRDQAGVPYPGDRDYPIDDIAEVDNTCRMLWGAPADEDPTLCANDPHLPTATPEGYLTPTPTQTASATQPGLTASPGPSATPTPSITPTFPLLTATWTPTPSSTVPVATPTECYVVGAAGQIRCSPTPPPVTPTDTPTRPPAPTATPTVCMNPFGQECTPTPEG